MKMAWNMISYTKWNLGNESCPYNPLATSPANLPTNIQNSMSLSKWCKISTRKHNPPLISKLWVFTSLSLSLFLFTKFTTREQEGEASRGNGSMWERRVGCQNQSGPILTTVNHSKWLTYLGWGGVDDRAWMAMPLMSVHVGLPHAIFEDIGNYTWRSNNEWCMMLLVHYNNQV